MSIQDKIRKSHLDEVAKALMLEESTGVQGATGATGPTGPTGPVGATGATGPSWDYTFPSTPGATGTWYDNNGVLTKVGA